jgi:hypothetical protein
VPTTTLLLYEKPNSNKDKNILVLISILILGRLLGDPIAMLYIMVFEPWTAREPWVILFSNLNVQDGQAF